MTIAAPPAVLTVNQLIDLLQHEVMRQPEIGDYHIYLLGNETILYPDDRTTRCEKILVTEPVCNSAADDSYEPFQYAVVDEGGNLSKRQLWRTAKSPLNAIVMMPYRS